MKYLKIFTNFVEKMELLGDAERGRLFTAMLLYAETGAEPELKGNERFLWKTAKQEIDMRDDAYNSKVAGAAKAREKRSDIKDDQKKNSDIKEKILISSQEQVQEQEKVKEQEYIKPPKSPLKGDVFADFAGEDKALLAALKDFAEMRKHIKAPLTDRAKQMLVNKLQREFEPEQWVPVIEQSTFKGWKDIYAIKGKDDKPPEKGSPNWVGGMPKMEKDWDAIMARAKERAQYIGKKEMM